MADITLPRWIITNRCMPAGRRTAPKPVLVVPVAQHEISGFSKGSYFDRPGAYQPQVIKDVFEHWEYRFWCMCTWPPAIQILAECRVCGHLGEQDPMIRQGHFKQSGCAKRLCAAYSLLLKDMKCVICDKKALRAKWGVPLCSSACTQAFCEQESQPNALKAALELVGEVA